jgi:hypothetical protein
MPSASKLSKKEEVGDGRREGGGGVGRARRAYAPSPGGAALDAGRRGAPDWGARAPPAAARRAARRARRLIAAHPPVAAARARRGRG